MEPALKEVKAKQWAACHHIEGFETAPITPPVLEHRREVVPESMVGTADTARAQELLK
jgi:hypothetical protein